MNPRNLIKAQSEMVLNAKSRILAEPVSVIEKCGYPIKLLGEKGIMEFKNYYLSKDKD